jgi:hypothetical protein
MDTRFSLRHRGYLTQTECDALAPLRVRYQGDHGLFTNGELARLRFLLWLVQQRHWGGTTDGKRGVLNG